MTPQEKENLKGWAEYFLEVYEAMLELCLTRFPLAQAKELAMHYTRADIEAALIYSAIKKAKGNE